MKTSFPNKPGKHQTGAAHIFETMS
jgi:hypothetical protein